MNIKLNPDSIRRAQAMMDDRSHETRLSKLLRQYPKAKAEVIKEYYQCPAYLGYSCPNPKVNCKDCWDTPIEEGQERADSSR